MCHPGLYGSIQEIYNTRQYRQIEEMSALTDIEVLKLLNKRKIEITSFNALCQQKVISLLFFQK